MLNKIISDICRFFMSNLELFVLCFALQFWFNAGYRWEYWATVILVSISNAISIEWKKDNNI